MSAQLEQISANLERLEQANTQLHIRMNSLEICSHRERRKLRIQAGLAFTGFLAAVFVSPGNRAAIAQGVGSLEARVAALEYKTQYMSVDTTARSTTFSGCNVFINDGGGSTASIVQNAAGCGLGNLTIGYNSLRGGGDNRTGVHSLILGDYQNYSSYGGFVVGNANTVSGPYASVGGGTGNIASGYISSANGYYNTANGSFSSISGGANNTASGDLSAILGGYYNTASGYLSSISGGYSNTSGGSISSVSGGGVNVAGGSLSCVSGGNGVTQMYDYGWAAGGTGSGDFYDP